MSRSGYSDDCEHLALWRGSVDRAILGRRGQVFMRKLRTALDAMPAKRLIADQISTDSGEVCALGAVDPAAHLNAEDRDEVARHFNIAPAMAAEIAYVNDEHWMRETPEERWTRVRAWVDQQIGPNDEPEQP